MISLKAFKQNQSSLWIFLFYAVIAGALLAPIASQTAIPSMADFINHLAEIIQAKAALMSGQFPLRMAPLWSYPIYQFYSPSTYLVAGLIYWFLTPHNPLIAYQLITWLSLTLGGIYMARVSYWFTGVRIAALLSGVVYLATPYNIIVNFRIGDLNEGVALGVLPIVLFYTLKYFQRSSDQRSLLKMVLAYYLLITTHLVTAVYFTVFVALFLLMIGVKHKRYLGHWLSVMVGYGWGVLLALWFLGPVVFFQKYLYVSGTFHTTEHLMNFRPNLSNLLSSVALVTRGSLSAVATLHPALGWPIIFAFGVGCYAYFNQEKSGNKRMDDWLPALLILFAVAFFCVWSPINFWQWLPTPLLIAQYSWRLLGQVMWIGSILFAFSIAWIFKNQFDKKHILIGAFLIMMSVSPWFVSAYTFKVSLADFVKTPFLVFNNNAYLINFDQYPSFVEEVNTIKLNINHLSNLNAPIGIPYPLLKIATNPYLVMQGKFKEALNQEHYSWAAFSNHQLLAKGNIRSGNFSWRVLLPAYPDLPQNNNLLQINFELFKNGKKVSKWFENPVDKATLYGFTDAAKVIDVKVMQKICQPKGSYTQCNINVPHQITTIELPIYYYPKLYEIKNNGQTVSYHGILDGETLLAGITPMPDAMNAITIQFRGFPWANWMSLIAWGVWILYGLYQFFRYRDNH